MNEAGSHYGGYAMNSNSSARTGSKEINMNKRSVSFWLVWVCFALVTSGLLGCEPRTANLSPLPSPTPFDTAFPRPTLAGGTPYRHYGLLVTPLPNEQLRLGTIAEVAPFVTPIPARYSIRNDYMKVGANQEFVLYVHDAQTGKETRLGNDDGHAEFRVMTDEYLIWKYLCDACLELKSGLYAYSLKTGNNTLITGDRLKDYPEIAGQWLIYSERPLGSDFIANLYAYHLGTGKETLITDKLGLLLVSPSDYYAIDGQRIVWLGVTPEGGMRVYDLTTRTVQVLDLPDLFAPAKLNIYGDVVIWKNEFWQGYDLKYNAYFTIPVLPAGWENRQIEKVGPVVANGRRIYWSLTVSGRTHYFAAPIIPKQ